MSHLGDLVAALVDNELSHDQRDRALAHVAVCLSCRREVEAQRRLKAALHRLPAPAPSPDLIVRLSFVASVSSSPPTRPGARRPGAPVRPAAGRPTTAPTHTRVLTRPGARPSRRRLAVGSVSAFALACGVAVLLGGQDTAPAVRPPVANFVQDHGATTSNLPFSDPATVVLTSFGR